MSIAKMLSELCKERQRIVLVIQDLEHLAERPRLRLIKTDGVKRLHLRPKKMHENFPLQPTL